MPKLLVGQEFIESVKELTHRYGSTFTYVCIAAKTIDSIQPAQARDVYGAVWKADAAQQQMLAKEITGAFHALTHKEASKKCKSDDLLMRISPEGSLKTYWQGKAVCGNHRRQVIKPA